jgi:hypothetical protein
VLSASEHLRNLNIGQASAGWRSESFGRKERKMLSPQVGDILEELRTNCLFMVKKITRDFVILHALEGSIQILTGRRSLDSFFTRVPLHEFQPLAI